MDISKETFCLSPFGKTLLLAIFWGMKVIEENHEKSKVAVLPPDH